MIKFSSDPLIRFKEDVIETSRLSKLARYSYVFKPLYVS
jgi:hypothetical protein